MILADGARKDVFEQLLAAGELPNIQQNIVSQGGCYTGVTSFPSTTGPAYFPFLQGCHPGTLNVVGVRWVDKEKFADPKANRLAKFRSYVGLENFLIGKDRTTKSPSLFELIPNAYSVFSSVAPGAGWRDKTKILRIWYVYYAHLTDRWGMIDTKATERTLKLFEKDFGAIFTVFPSIDEFSHIAHPHHPSTIEAYKKFDQSMGKLVDRLKKLGKWDDTLFWIFSDHGLTATHTHFCCNGFLEKRGFDPLYFPTIYPYRNKNAANMMSGNGMTHLYFKNRESWKGVTTRKMLEALDPSLTRDLLDEKAVALVLCRNTEGGVDVLSQQGEAKILKSNGTLHYEVTQRADPFGFGSLPKVMDAETALQQTWNSPFPDAIWQIAKLFEAPRTGDVVLSAHNGFDLRDKYEIPEHKGSHGSLARDHMWVPLMVNAPMKADVMRTVDVFPTTLQLLGHAIPAGIDGVVR